MDGYIYGTHPKQWQEVKICTYSICKNEVKFTQRWLENIWNKGKGSDYICVLDTGSTDGTVENLKKIAEELNIPKDRFIIDTKVISPWRFDVARNESINLIPSDLVDVCYCIDLDEIIDERFWDDLRKIVFEHPNFKGIHYRYAWSHKSNGEPDWQFWYDKIHGPKGWQWEFPVHETLKCSCPEIYDGKIYYLNKDIIYLHHYPNPTKSRGNYLPLLKLRVKENPTDIVSNYYLTREYSYYKMWQECLDQCTTTMGLFNSEKLYPYEDYFGSICYLRGLASYYLRRNCSAAISFNYGISNAPKFKTNYICLAQMYAYENHSDLCYDVLNKMHKNAETDTSWMVEGWVNSKWKELQIIADAKCWEGKYAESFALIAYAKELITDSEKYSATKQNFYTDYNFIKKEFEKRVIK